MSYSSKDVAKLYTKMSKYLRLDTAIPYIQVATLIQRK